MKRLIILTVAFVLMFAMSSFAFEPGLTGYGLKAGVNMANFSGDDVDIEGADKKMRLGFSAGGFVTYSISEMFALQPEVFYTMKGAKYEAEDGDVTFKYDYLEIPVLAKVTIPTEGNIAPNLFIGPALAINLSAKAKADVDIGGYEAGVELDVKDWTKSTDFGLVFGAGVDIGMPHSAITVDGRYVLGLATTHEAEEGEEEEDIKNGVISFMVGYTF